MRNTKTDEQRFLLGELERFSWYRVLPKNPPAPAEVRAARRLVKAWENKLKGKNERFRKAHEKKLSKIRAVIYIDKDYKKALEMIKALAK